MREIFQLQDPRLHLMKSVSKKLVSMVVDSPSFLNKAMMFFPILSTTGPLLLLITASPPSLYCTTFSLPIKLHSLSRRYVWTTYVHKSWLY